ncbi:MAG: arginyl-tRNA synthetase, partial [Haloquadratum sp. J07HQX50]
MDSSPV